MDALCNALNKCQIDDKPNLYNMMINDFTNLANQYLHSSNCFTFEMQNDIESISIDDINELLIYIQKQKCENLLIEIIKYYHPDIFIDKNMINSIIDYYMDLLSLCI